MVEPISPARRAASACGSHGTAEATWPCVGEKPGRPCARSKPSSSSRGELAAADGERADQLVVAAGDVARPGGLGDLGVVQLGRVAVDVEDPAAEPLERLDDEILEHGLLGRAGADAVAADRVEAELRRAVAGRRDEHREAGEHVLEDRARRGGARPRTSSPAWRATRRRRRRRAGRRRRRRATPATTSAWTGPQQNAFTSLPEAFAQPACSAIALAEVAAAALVAVADRLLPAPDRVRDVLRGEAARPRAGARGRARRSPCRRGSRGGRTRRGSRRGRARRPWSRRARRSVEDRERRRSRGALAVEREEAEGVGLLPSAGRARPGRRSTPNGPSRAAARPGAPTRGARAPRAPRAAGCRSAPGAAGSRARRRRCAGAPVSEARSPSRSAASSRAGLEPCRTRSGACARTSEQEWIAARPRHRAPFGTTS